jgi:hypothetical protein
LKYTSLNLCTVTYSVKLQRSELATITETDVDAIEANTLLVPIEYCPRLLLTSKVPYQSPLQSSGYSPSLLHL